MMVPGHKLLQKWLDRTKTTRAKLAVLLDITPQTVSGYLVDGHRPSFQYREMLQKIAGVPVESWLTAEEKRYARKVRAA